MLHFEYVSHCFDNDARSRTDLREEEVEDEEEEEEEEEEKEEEEEIRGEVGRDE